MNMKQLLCLLVLAVSGNTFGSNAMPTQPPVIGGNGGIYHNPNQGVTPPPMPVMNVTEMATTHFAPLMQGMPMQHPAMTKMNEICKMLNADLMKQCMQCMQDAYSEGVKAGLMAAGTHMQAAMTAMGNVMKAPKTDIAAIVKAQGWK